MKVNHFYSKDGQKGVSSLTFSDFSYYLFLLEGIRRIWYQNTGEALYRHEMVIKGLEVFSGMLSNFDTLYREDMSRLERLIK